MATIYYIDSENVGDSWIALLQHVEGRFVVFYTGRSPRIAYSQMIQVINAVNRPEFIECHEGNNGLDFQLVTYLGYELHADPTSEMIIVSNDTGFDAVVLFWVERGMNVKRIPSSNILISQLKNIPVSEEMEFTTSSSVKLQEKLFGIDTNEISEIINCIGKEDSVFIHLAFVHFYGNKNGDNIYKYMKKEKFAVDSFHWTKEIRLKKLIGYIIQYTNTANFPVPESVAGFVAKYAVDDKKTMGNLFNQSYGEYGPQLNKMFKPFYKALAKIKVSV